MGLIAVIQSGMICSVGGGAEGVCAAIRASCTNFTQTRFKDRWDEPIAAAQVELARPLLVSEKLVAMASQAILEACAGLVADPQQVPLLLCGPEQGRPGGASTIDDSTLLAIERVTHLRFHPNLSTIVPGGSVAAIRALELARQILLGRADCRHVLIAGADSFLLDRTLTALESAEQLLTSQNSNGFVPGEGASAVLLGPPGTAASMLCTGVGLSAERATSKSELPQRADGLVQAMTQALRQAQLEMGDIDWRVVDLSGEQYYFKEAALALTRTLRTRKEGMPMWHPADVVGNIGAAAGPLLIAVALAAMRGNYAPGSRVLCHAANDLGERGAAVFEFRESERA